MNEQTKKRLLNVVVVVWLILIFVGESIYINYSLGRGSVRFDELMIAIFCGLSFIFPMLVGYVLGYGFRLFHRA
ncbi:hypothetical protein CGK29_09540 [Vibrio parahaemolyticus]|nr:hypothetical protein CGK29_09540 [Vibrio parahaemolyticus]